MKKTLILLLFLIFSAISSHASSIPEIFVQTGHSSGVKFVAINQNGRYLVTMESGGYIKTWETATGKEIRTVKLGPEYVNINNLYFLDDSRFIVFHPKGAEIFDIYGQKTESINFPKNISADYPVISKDRQYLFTQGIGKKIYSIKDASEISLPELRKYQSFERYHEGLADLGYGHYGVFHKGQSPKGNVDYVIYDDSLNVFKKGTLNIPDVYFGSKFKISPDLKYAAYQGRKSSDGITDIIYAFSLETGEQILSYKPRSLAKGTEGLIDEQLNIGFIPDGRLKIEYVKQRNKPEWASRMEVVLINPAKNGIYSENRLVLDNLDTFLSTMSSPYVVTDKGMLIAGFTNGNVRMIDMNTSTEIRNFGVKPSLFMHSSCSGNRIINWSEDTSISQKYFNLHFNIWDLGEAALQKMNVTTGTGLHEKPVKIVDHIFKMWFSTDPETLYHKIPADFFTENYKNEDNYGRMLGLFSILNDSGDFSATSEQHKLVLKSKKTKKKLADLFAFEDGEWIIMTPDGYYSASANGDKYLSVRMGNNIYGIENYREAFFRPDLVKLALAGNSLEGYRTLASIGSPPVIKIENTPEKTSADFVSVTVRITDTGGGVGDVRLYLNDTSVMTDSARSVRIKSVTDKKSTVKSYTLKLLNGDNTIKAIAFDKENNVQSNPAVQKITASYKAVKKPVMYALVIGINEYKNPKLTLKYATADAELFADTLQEAAGRLFDKVNITRLTSKEAASKDNILKELDKYKNINPDDIFAFYVASHGTVDDGEYYLITSNVGALSTEKLKAEAITQKELRERIANVPAAKKLIVIDTCNAGKLGEQLQMAMLTRGMSEDTAMKILSRAVGSTIISASTSLQEALEGYKDHGLFTYVLTEGMRGKADASQSGYVKTSDLASYVEEKVPEIAESFFKRPQYPTKAVNGQDFPIGRIK